MIVHVFTAERYHLVPLISKGFATAYKDDGPHRFLLVGGPQTDQSLYNKLFSGIGFTDYHFVLSKHQLYRLLMKNRKNPILFHAGSYSFFLTAFIAGCQHVNWVCWGSGASIRNNWKSKLTAPLKSLVYRRFNSIVTLMDDDMRTIIRDFNVDSNKIQTIPYASAGIGVRPRDEICLKLLNEKAENRQKPIVLLGNNPSNMRYYIMLMDKLKPFKGKICVHCMMNYSVNKNQQYDDFIKLGKDLFGDDFRSDEEFYQGSEKYANYMNSCDIYMCASPDQTGLGALNTVLELGKKVYITGKNYNWAKNDCGAIVFEIKDVTDFEDLVKPLTDEEKHHNYQAMVNRRKLPPILWQKYLKQLNTK